MGSFPMVKKIISNFLSGTFFSSFPLKPYKLILGDKFSCVEPANFYQKFDFRALSKNTFYILESVLWLVQ
jgi:hypothetical protein